MLMINKNALQQLSYILFERSHGMKNSALRITSHMLRNKMKHTFKRNERAMWFKTTVNPVYIGLISYAHQKHVLFVIAVYVDLHNTRKNDNIDDGRSSRFEDEHFSPNTI